jgi:hypothetical protein
VLRVMFFLLFLGVSSLAAGQTPDEHPRFVVDLPPQWQESRLRVVIEGVRAPGNVPFKLRVTAMGEDKKEVSLGSVGVEAIGPSKTAPRTLRPVRLDITRSLQRFLGSKSNPEKIELGIQPVDARNNPIRNLEWSVKSVRLEVPPK